MVRIELKIWYGICSIKGSGNVRKMSRVSVAPQIKRRPCGVRTEVEAMALLKNGPTCEAGCQAEVL